MENAFERFVCEIHKSFDGLHSARGVHQVGILDVGMMDSVGTVVTFDVFVGEKHRTAVLTFDAEVVRGGIKVVPKKLSQILSLDSMPFQFWVSFFEKLQDPVIYSARSLRTFTIPWKLYDKFRKDPDAWLRDVLERYINEKEKEA